LVSPTASVDAVVDVDLERALAALSHDLRSVVVGRFLLDWSVDQTADALGVPPGTVKSRLSRALRQLERAMCEDAP
jgi:RNA polymerase sigma-70 factor (ECF subfamily)